MFVNQEFLKVESRGSLKTLVSRKTARSDDISCVVEGVSEVYKIRNFCHRNVPQRKNVMNISFSSGSRFSRSAI